MVERTAETGDTASKPAGSVLPELEAAVARGAASFSQYLGCHFYRQEKFNPVATTRAEYERLRRDVLGAFQAKHGQIIKSYWALTTVAGVVLTDTHEVHVANNTMAPDLVDAATKCRELIVRLRALGDERHDVELSADVLYDACTGWISILDEYAADRDVTADTEASDDATDVGDAADDAKRSARVEALPKRLTLAELHIARAELRRAHTAYFLGLVQALGAVALVLGSLFALDYGTGSGPDTTRTALLAATGLATMGAAVSVLIRVSRGTLRLDTTANRGQIALIGSIRPLLGAVFGLVFALAIVGELIRIDPPEGTAAIGFFGAIAFVAGFSERVASGLIAGIEGAVGTPGQEPDSPQEALDATAADPPRDAPAVK